MVFVCLTLKGKHLPEYIYILLRIVIELQRWYTLIQIFNVFLQKYFSIRERKG